MWITRQLILLGFLLLAEAADEKSKKNKYCIIGAGPAGVQLGHFLQKEGLDYVTWERGERAASFFRNYPIHRKLISINRYKTRSTNPEFNLRHDWNSLIDVNVPLFANWTKEYFPSADVLVKYLQAAADLQEANILYSHAVKSVKRSKKDSFTVTVSTPNGELNWRCSVVIGANGLWKPNTPTNWIRGMKHTFGYHELTPWPGSEAFEGKSVLILGNGNGAFETADAVREGASDIGILGRREERMAHETHYVGNVRLARGTALDSMQLNSLDDVFHLSNEVGMHLEFLPCAGSQGGNGWPQGAYDRELSGFRGRPPVCTLSDHSKNEFLLADNDPMNPAVKDALSKFGKHIKTRQVSKSYAKYFRDWKQRLKISGTNPDAVPRLKAALARKKTVLTISKATARQLANESMDFRLALPKLMATTQGLYLAHDRLRKPWDIVIRALGWKMEFDAFKTLEVEADEAKKYPKVDHCFESSEQDLYFAGTVTHGYDKIKFGSAGGFIHGFRYTSRSLFHCLLNRYETAPLWRDGRTEFAWNVTAASSNKQCTSIAINDKTLPEVSCGWSPTGGSDDVETLRQKLTQTPLWSRLAARINEASGPYQMSCGALVDGIVFDAAAGKAIYYQDIPVDIFEGGSFANSPRLLFMFRYGAKDEERINEPSVLRTRMVAYASLFLHPVLFFMRPGSTLKSSSRLHLVEDRWTDFSGREEVLALHHFLTAIEKAAWDNSVPAKFHEVLDNLNATCDHHHL
eukprot:TRINITY_DN22610_c5_g1_i1.p1 TRINITY_DN22610_c5_g1~~TRINITY_DN22610_c5_g1_i1.p1  ORF type:complete len:747 (+),score=126.57 TRINITY_DN22610_c5_g1_i1:67-2307(+)